MNGGAKMTVAIWYNIMNLVGLYGAAILQILKKL